MGRFGGAVGAQASKGGVYPKDGLYKVKIKALKAGQTRKKVDFFVAELHILESSNSERPAGSEMSWMVTMDKDAAGGNINGFLCELTGSQPEEIDEAGIEAAVSAANPFEGAVLKMQATTVATRSGGQFTKCLWTLLEPPPKLAASAA